jgi:hypothetical protein
MIPVFDTKQLKVTVNEQNNTLKNYLASRDLALVAQDMSAQRAGVIPMLAEIRQKVWSVEAQLEQLENLKKALLEYNIHMSKDVSNTDLPPRWVYIGDRYNIANRIELGRASVEAARALYAMLSDADYVEGYNKEPSKRKVPFTRSNASRSISKMADNWKRPNYVLNQAYETFDKLMSEMLVKSQIELINLEKSTKQNLSELRKSTEDLYGGKQNIPFEFRSTLEDLLRDDWD